MRKHMHYSAHEYKSVFSFFLHELTCNSDTASRRENHYIKMLFFKNPVPNLAPKNLLYHHILQLS